MTNYEDIKTRPNLFNIFLFVTLRLAPPLARLTPFAAGRAASSEVRLRSFCRAFRSFHSSTENRGESRVRNTISSRRACSFNKYSRHSSAERTTRIRSLFIGGIRREGRGREGEGCEICSTIYHANYHKRRPCFVDIAFRGHSASRSLHSC